MNLVENVILVYKRNLRASDLLGRKRDRGWSPFVREDLKRLNASRHAHAQALRQVQRIVRATGIPYRAIYRVRHDSYGPRDLIVSMGGDGTFMEAARAVRNQWIVGVNSDPARSVGSFCCARAETFEKILAAVLRGKVRLKRLNRLQLKLNGKPLSVAALNEILVTHRKPAAMSRYWLEVGRIKERQRSSGLWIATAAGSTGAIRSAGGRLLDRSSRAIQYKPRELYRRGGVSYSLRGGLLQPGDSLRVGSLMREGLICIDGEHLTFPFRYADILRVSNSPYPLTAVEGSRD